MAWRFVWFKGEDHVFNIEVGHRSIEDVMSIDLKGCEVVKGRREQRDADCVGGVQGSEVNGDYGLDLGQGVCPVFDRVLEALDFIVLSSADGCEVEEVCVSIAEKHPLDVRF